ncbi:hypothetical protein JTB14_032498 [Gonioctena quinquepunctata]|nr:hypothetical protein JTB14_032498 [Gonioctena quinquepunctata]
MLMLNCFQRKPDHPVRIRRLPSTVAKSRQNQTIPLERRQWNILQNSLTDKVKQIKRVCDTRWSSRVVAVCALADSYKNIKEVLIQLSTSGNEKPVAKLEALKLTESFNAYEVALMTGTNLLNSLMEFVKDIRNNFETIEADSQKLTDNRNFKDGKKRARKRKQHFDKTTENEIYLTGKDAFIVNLHNIISDRLIIELGNRSV